MKYEEAIKLLTSKDNFYINLGLDRINKVLDIFGNPQDSLRFIHVAGTNGKGSVCTMLDAVLRAAGYRTGLYTSPHIWEYTERIRFNGTEIPKQTFADYVEHISNMGVHLTEFEILTVMAFLYFKSKNADIVILETGLGGRLDATNVIGTNLCSVITHIDLEHTDRLGNTKEEIAAEKAGIIKRECPVITNMEFNSIKNKAQVENSPIIRPKLNVKNKYTDALALKGLHQTENLKLVLTVIEKFFPNITEDIVIQGLKDVKNPCRFEYKKEANVIIDASHNPNGISALRKNLDTYFPNQERRFVFGCLSTKNYKEMMKILFREEDEVYINEFDYPKACTYMELAEASPVPVKRYESKKVLTPDKLNIICGSFYMIGQMKFLR